jgi:hypothetical protein
VEAPSLDHLVAQALATAATLVHPEPGDKSFLEKRLAHAVATALYEPFGEDRVVRDRRLVGGELPDWSPQPGTIDVAVVTQAYEPRITFELKIDHVDQTLWDIYKMVSATMLPTVEAAYVAIAARQSVWASSGDCVELFDVEPREDTGGYDPDEWYSRFLFAHHHRAWKDLLAGGSGRPVRVPDQITIHPLGRWPVPAYPSFELRAIRVEPGESGWVEFENDWPKAETSPATTNVDQPRLISNETLRIEDLPLPGSPEQGYHEFALSFDGYRQLGSLKRCARIANGSLERWSQTGDLPTTISELRGCIFFEQRRWHHYGYGFDDATMDYLKALIAKLRELL